MKVCLCGLTLELLREEHGEDFLTGQIKTLLASFLEHPGGGTTFPEIPDASGVAAVATQARRKNLKLSWALIGFLFLGTSWASFALPNAGPVVARLESKPVFSMRQGQFPFE